MEFVHNSSVPVRWSLAFPEKDLNEQVGRFTAFTFIFYPDQEHDHNYLFSFLANIRIPSAVSPLHDKDINELNCDSGEVEYKKPHYHVVIDFGSGNKKTIKQIYELIRPIRNFISIAPFDYCVFDDYLDNVLNDFDLSSSVYEPDDSRLTKVKKVWLMSNAVRNMRSLLRYFKHLDNPEKFQYQESITSFGGFEVEDRIYSVSDAYCILDDIFDWIEEHDCYSFWNLLKYCRKNNREWYAVICKNMYANIILNAMKSFAVENTGYLEKKIERYNKED